MKHTTAKHATVSAAGSLAEPLKPQYKLHLYVAGMTPRSVLAIANIREICAEHLKGRHDLRVIDLCQQPALAEGEQIIALPTLLRKMPLPLRRIIGDLSERERVLNALDLKPKVGG